MGISYVSKRAIDLDIPVVDATKPMTIEVEAKDIRGGTRKNPETCAFARATCREFGDVIHAYFLKSTAWIEYPNQIVKYALPMSMQKEIVAFDRGLKMAPGVYKMSPPPPSATAEGLRKANQRRKMRRRKEAKKGERKPEKARHVYHITAGVRGLRAPEAVPAK